MIFMRTINSPFPVIAVNVPLVRIPLIPKITNTVAMNTEIQIVETVIIIHINRFLLPVLLLNVEVYLIGHGR